MYWTEIQKMSNALKELGYDVEHMGIGEIISVYTVLEREGKL